MSNAAVLIDENLNRALVLTASADQSLAVSALPLGKQIVSTTASFDRSLLFVLSAGEERLLPGSEGPALTVIAQGALDKPKRYELPDAMTSVSLDPEGKIAIVYAGDSTAGGFITNPSELIFVDLTKDPSAGAVVRRNLPSNSGGSPKRLTFTPPLHFPSGDRRLLVIETDRDVMLLDLDNPASPEISLPVSDVQTDPRPLSPRGIAIDPGNALAMRPPVIALRTDQDDNVVIYTLGPSNKPAPYNDFAPTPNTAYVGGVPSDIAFVSTLQGPRLAVMVPANPPSIRLIDVDDNQTLTAKLIAPYDTMSIVAPLPGAASQFDRLLLWSATGSVSSVALWDLANVPDAAYSDVDTLKNIETLNVGGAVSSVVDVADHSLKVLETSNHSLYVLDLQRHTASPLNTSAQVTLRFAQEGDRAWAFEPSQAKLAQIALAGPLVTPVPIDRPVEDVVEIARSDGKMALLALHSSVPGVLANNASSASFPEGANIGVTVFDALAPDAVTSRRYSSLMLERLAP